MKLCGLAAFMVVFFSALSIGQRDPSVLSGIQGSNREEHSDNLRTVASLALQHGELAKAEDAFQQALATDQRLTPDGLEVARDFVGLGDVAQERGKLSAAAEYYQAALNITQKRESKGLENIQSIRGLGRVAMGHTEWDTAQKRFAQALSLQRRFDPESLMAATLLNDLSDVARKRDDLVKAQALNMQALAIQTKLAPDSLDMAESLTRLGMLAFRRGNRAKADEFHHQALAIREKLAPGSLAVANSFWWLGICSQDEQQAEAYYRKGLAIQQKLAPVSLPLALSLLYLSRTLLNSGDLVQAEQYQRQALIIHQTLSSYSMQTAEVLDSLAKTFAVRGDLAGAEEYYRQALALKEKVNASSAETAWSYSELGGLLRQRGDLAKAGEYYRRAYAIRKKVDPAGIELAISLTDLGNLAGDYGDLPKAEEYVLRALALERRFGNNSVEVANSFQILASIARDGGNWRKAERYQRQALAICEKFAPGSLFVAWSASNLGSILQERGDAGAEEHYRRAQGIYQEFAPDSLYSAENLNRLGNVAERRNDFVQAERYYGAALAIREKVVPGSESHAETLAGLASVMRHTQRPELAAQLFERSINALEDQAGHIGGGQELRSGFRARHGSYYKDYIDLLISQKQPELAFQVLERFRGRTLLETLAEARADIKKGVDPALTAQEEKLRLLLSAQLNRRVGLLSSKKNQEQESAVNKEIEKLLAEYREVQELIRVNSPGYAALTQPQPLSALEIQRSLLDDESLLLEYSLGEERSYVFAVSPNSLRAYEIPKRAEVENAARRVYALLTARNRSVQGETDLQWQARSSKAEAEYPGVAAELSRMVLGPMAGQLSAKRLLIVSDGALEYVPFAALPAPQPTSRFENDVPLITEHEIVNLPSASVVASLRHQGTGHKRASKEVAVLADPVFDSQDPRVVQASGGTRKLKAEEEISRDRLTRSLAGVHGSLYLRRLPYTRKEADAIMAVIPSGSGLQVLDFRANRAMATSPDLAKFRIIHFATHGLLNSEQPELSGLVFSMVNEQGSPQNGFLGLQDIFNLDLTADLVVLSGCETGLGKQITGEGLVGMTRGFMFAGATQVVASLWNVSDAATARLMARFYKAVEKNGMRPAAALRAAQVEMWRQKRWRSPYYWAAFQIQGEWR